MKHYVFHEIPRCKTVVELIDFSNHAIILEYFRPTAFDYGDTPPQASGRMSFESRYRLVVFSLSLSILLTDS